MSKANTTSSAKRTQPLSLQFPRTIYNFFFLCRVSTLRAAIELKSVFDQIQAAEKAGNLSPDEKKKLEEQAAEKGLQALFKVRPSSKFSKVPLIDPLLYRARNSKLNPSSVKHVIACWATPRSHERRQSSGL